MTFERCPTCEGTASLVRDYVDFKIGTRTAHVRIERFRCDECEEEFYTPSQAENAQRTAADEMRRQEDLLMPDKIKAVRKRFGLTQAHFEQLLGAGPKTVVRWERGTVFQSRSIDQLIRAIDAIPGVFEFLASRNGLSVAAIQDTEGRAREYQMKVGEPVGELIVVDPDVFRQKTIKVPREKDPAMPVFEIEALK